jgi:hypothetical protein
MCILCDKENTAAAAAAVAATTIDSSTMTIIFKILSNVSD